MRINREPATTPPDIRRINGVRHIINLHSTEAILIRPFYPVYVDEVGDGRVQISDEQTNVVVTGRLPEAYSTYRDRLVQVSAHSPESVPQLRSLRRA